MYKESNTSPSMKPGYDSEWQRKCILFWNIGNPQNPPLKLSHISNIIGYFYPKFNYDIYHESFAIHFWWPKVICPDDQGRLLNIIWNSMTHQNGVGNYYPPDIFFTDRPIVSLYAVERAVGIRLLVDLYKRIACVVINLQWSGASYQLTGKSLQNRLTNVNKHSTINLKHAKSVLTFNSEPIDLAAIPRQAEGIKQAWGTT